MPPSVRGAEDGLRLRARTCGAQAHDPAQARRDQIHDGGRDAGRTWALPRLPVPTAVIRREDAPAWRRSTVPDDRETQTDPRRGEAGLVAEVEAAPMATAIVAAKKAVNQEAARPKLGDRRIPPHRLERQH